jgi:2-oxoglutarate ferredoxin oxidoreductase subunit alpha
MEKFSRYMDVDGDGIPYRTLPGVHSKGAYFTRGSGHDKHARYTEDEEGYTDVMMRIARKIDGAALALPVPVLRSASSGKPAPLGIVGIGGGDRALKESQDLLADAGIQADYLRVRAFPFHPSVKEFLEGHQRIVIVEQNRDAQLRSLLALETAVPLERLESVRHWGGMPLSAADVVEDVLALLDRPSASEPPLVGSLA